MTLHVAIPFSLIYYTNNIFGIGFSYSIGYKLHLISFQPFRHSIDNIIRISNKIGACIKKKWFILEYGIILSSLISLTNYYSVISPINHFGIGPSILLGFESISSKGFEITVGFLFDSVFETTDYFDSIYKTYTFKNQKNTDIIDIHFHFGLELRWRFAYFKKLKR